MSLMDGGDRIRPKEPGTSPAAGGYGAFMESGSSSSMLVTALSVPAGAYEGGTGGIRTGGATAG